MAMTERMASARKRLTRTDWAAAALAAIADGGLPAVAVEPLAVRLGTTKGSFYWHFANRDALLEAALELWEEATTTAVLAQVGVSSVDPRDQLRLLIRLVVDIAEQDRVGIAILADSSHPVVRKALERVTRARIDGVVSLFRKLGFPPVQARQRGMLAYSAYLGHAQLAHSTPALLPTGVQARRAYLDHVVNALARPEDPKSARRVTPGD
jgi:AcrR family transcriptional regulator